MDKYEAKEKIGYLFMSKESEEKTPESLMVELNNILDELICYEREQAEQARTSTIINAIYRVN